MFGVFLLGYPKALLADFLILECLGSIILKLSDLIIEETFSMLVFFLILDGSLF